MILLILCSSIQSYKQLIYRLTMYLKRKKNLDKRHFGGMKLINPMNGHRFSGLHLHL